MAKPVHYHAVSHGPKCTITESLTVGDWLKETASHRVTTDVEKVTCPACKLYIIEAIRRNA